MRKIFKSADILLPKSADMTKWSVVACDQYTSEPEYWAELERVIGAEPSTLHLMLPEAYLETCDQFEEAEKINKTMLSYLENDVFEEIKDSYIYVERTQRNGKIRRGLVGVLDLDEYDYSRDSVSPIRATEGTIVDRLPPRVQVRRGACIEMPHIMVFIDDSEGEVIAPLAHKSAELPKLSDFDLSANGGHLRGWQICGEAAAELECAVAALADAEKLRERYGDRAPAIFAMGDGNHSLATAKKCWEEIKPTLTDAERENHPARFSLVELVNIHDEAIEFEPIHKVVFETEPSAFIAQMRDYWKKNERESEKFHTLRLAVGSQREEIRVHGLTIGELIGLAEEFCVAYTAAHGGKIDYIHNDDTAESMGARPGCAAVLLPAMEKGELFPSIINSGAFPKKSFSIGHAEDKRYYLECRKIK
ncbi:MAG: DUF1015 domain-containing protein [Oscillospiraceae bacterium]|nr:DUF1015 domain-containing protein [Oscillospiraceae bacterium]